MYREQLFAPVRLVALFERTFVLADAHAIRHAQLGHALTVVTVHNFSATPFLDSLHLLVTEPCRCCGGGGVVVRSHQVLKDVDVSPRLVFREVSPHARLQRSVETFHDACLRLRVVCGEMMDAVTLQ